MNTAYKILTATLLLFVFASLAYAQLSRSVVKPPNPPSNLTAVATSANQVALVWQDNSSDESGFKVERSVNDQSNFEEIAVTGTNITAFLDNTVIPSTLYYYRVRAFNAHGNSQYSNTVSVTTLDAPAPPSDLVAGAAESVLVVLIWQDNSDNETGFRIERSTIGSEEGFAQIGTSAENINFYFDTTVIENTTYWYRVAAFNSQGFSVYSNVVSVTTPGDSEEPRLTISVSELPPSQTVVAGTNQFTFANYHLDATQSDEDLRLTIFPLEYNVGGGGSATSLTSCQIFDGTTALNTGTNVVNPTTAASSTPFILDAGLIIEKATIKTIALKCNIAGGVSGEYAWGYDESSNPSVTGASSGQPAVLTEIDNPGQIMTVVPNGAYTVAENFTPGYRIVNSGSTSNTLLNLRFSAFVEDIRIDSVTFQLSDTASNTPLDLVKITLWDGATKVGEAVFTSDFATSTVNGFTVPKDGFKDMTIKGDINIISASGPLTFSGDLLKVDYDGDSNGNFGVGITSGLTISATSSPDTSVEGVRIMDAYPVFTKLPVPSNLLANSDSFILYRFSARAVAEDIAIYKLTFNISSSTGAMASATTSNYALYAYTDSSFSIPDTSFSPLNPDGLLNSSKCYFSSNSPDNAKVSLPNDMGVMGDNVDLEIHMDPSATACGPSLNMATTTYKVPALQTRYFELRTDVSNVETGPGTESFSVVLRGDQAFPVGHIQDDSNKTDMGAAGPDGRSVIIGVDNDENDDFIWSPMSTSTAVLISDIDFTNGYQVQGLPSTDMAPEIFVSPN